MKKIQLMALLISLSWAFVSCSQAKTEHDKKDGKAVKAAEHAEKKKIETPDDAMNELKAGNERFLKGEFINNDYPHQIEHTKDGQHPHTVVLGCLDSRVPPEIIFDQGIGDLFVARVAGNIEDDNVVGSMEFATKVKGTKLVVVLGHSSCGAVEGAVKDAKLGKLSQLLDQIKPALVGTDIDASAKNNVKMTINDILNQSPVLKELVDEGKVKIVGAFYDIATGKVDFID